MIRCKECIRTTAACILAISLVFSNIFLSNPGGSSSGSNGPSTTMEKVPAIVQMRQQHLEHVGMDLSRSFPEVSYKKWCIDASLKYEQNKGEPMGLCYLKIPRAASTTLAGINKRIAVNFAKRHNFTQSCIRHDGNVPGFYYRRRDPLSFLWTLVRDPLSRSLSRAASQFATTPDMLADPGSVMSVMQNKDLHYGGTSEGRGGFQLQYAMIQVSDESSAWHPSQPANIIDPLGLQERVKRVVESYDFIGTVERMDESLVALQLVLGLDTTDIIAFSSKISGIYGFRKKQQNGRRKSAACVKIQSYQPIPAVENFTKSDSFWAEHYGDYIFHAAANASLEKTIDRLGREIFAKALVEYRKARARTMKQCSPVFPCSSDGVLQIEESKQQCYAFEEGCGFRCIDDLFPSSTRAPT
uniref:Sulfotransferase domain-containing protein n=1 Tax=Craspedostauros australis TaxID=1486917 RepID=A0A7R9WT99_9STRA|mmetsp:Transcript_19878/g.55284  ORF Transcript_19878/g.55284 Transcript_19878/m.55284 type:complete len:413 (+) Transcript_19878:210-1448(+)